MLFYNDLKLFKINNKCYMLNKSLYVYTLFKKYAPQLIDYSCLKYYKKCYKFINTYFQLLTYHYLFNSIRT